MKQSQLFCCIPLMCLVTLFGIAILIKMDALGDLLIPISAGIDVVKHGLSSGIERRKVIKKIKVRRLPTGELVDMQGKIIPPEALANPQAADMESSKQNLVSLLHISNQTSPNLAVSDVNSQPHSAKQDTPFPRSSVDDLITLSQVNEHMLDDITKISQSQDIDERGKWQVEQVNKYCAKYKKRKLALILPKSTRSEFITRKNLFRHLIFDDERRLIFCFIPKVGCTNMRRFLFVLQGLIPQNSVNWRRVSEEDYLGPGVQKASFLNYSLTDSQRLYKIRNYWKFIIVRNPLERLLSAFINKLSSPVDFNATQMNTFDMHKQTIMVKYFPHKVKENVKNGNTKLQLDFETYLRWIIDTPNYKLNEHFAPIIDLSQPCRVKYNFYGNFKMYSSEMKAITERLGVPPDWFVDKSSHKHGRETKDLMIPFYSVVSKEIKERLVKDIWKELDFYYTLYPEESGTHYQILGLSES